MTGIAGSVTLGDGAVIAGRVGIADNLTIGARATIAAGSGVMNDIGPGETWFGYPARPHADQMRSIAAPQPPLRLLPRPEKSRPDARKGPLVLRSHFASHGVFFDYGIAPRTARNRPQGPPPSPRHRRRGRPGLLWCGSKWRLRQTRRRLLRQRPGPPSMTTSKPPLRTTSRGSRMSPAPASTAKKRSSTTPTSATTAANPCPRLQHESRPGRSSPPSRPSRRSPSLCSASLAATLVVPFQRTPAPTSEAPPCCQPSWRCALFWDNPQLHQQPRPSRAPPPQPLKHRHNGPQSSSEILPAE